MYERIKQLANEVKSVYKKFDFSDPIPFLKYLHSLNCSSTEAYFVLFQGFNLSEEDAEKVIMDTNIWAFEGYNQIFYEVALYSSS